MSTRVRLPVALLIAFALSRTASGSQYPLEQATVIIPPAQAPALRRAGVRNTGDFLLWGRTPDGRRLLAQRARIPVEQVRSWVLLADLLRVRGVGPDVARLLTAVGIRSLADLRRADAGATAAAIREYNRKAHLSTNPPGAESLQYWIDQSRSLPLVIVLD